MKNDIKNLISRLKNYYNALNEENLSEVVSFMNSKPMKEIYSIFLDTINNQKDIKEDEVDLLEIILKLTNLIYNDSGESTGLSDSDYDVLVEFYRNITNNDNFITEKLISDSNVEYHKYKTLRGTLDKIYKLTEDDVLKNKSQKSLEDWINTSERRIKDNSGKSIDIRDCDVFVMPKYDGVSIVFEVSKDNKLQRALLRGDTSRNETNDVSFIFKDIFVPPIKNPEYEYGFKTEVMMLDSDFEKYNAEYHTNYKNTRSIVSSILNSKEVDERVNYLKIIPLRISYFINGEESEQFLPDAVYNYPYLKCKLSDVEEIHNFSLNHKTVNPGLRCDGSVIRIEDKEIQKILGRENEKQKFEVAFKFTEETAYSKVKNVEFTTGRFGRMSPVVIFKPITMKGNLIERASLGSYARFKNLGLVKGDTIKITYDIIPYADFDESDPKCIKKLGKSIEPPLICPDCGTKYEENTDGTLYVCPNKNCPSRLKGRILNYCEKMNIENISYATITDFYKYGYINGIEDLYKLKDYRNQLIQLPGYKEKKIDNILESIESKMEVTPSQLFGSIGIEGISVKKFEYVFSTFFIDDIMSLAEANASQPLIIVHGVSDKTAQKIIDGVRNNEQLIKFLLKTLKVSKEPIHSKGDFDVVFTKVRDANMEQFIRDNGGTVSNDVTKNTSLVVVPVIGVSSNKVSKANKNGIPIVRLDEAMQYIRDNFLR